jgi:hypothetical protein
VGRPPQELKRGWVIEIIRKASTHDLVERGEKGRCGGKWKKKIAKRIEMGSES